MWSNLGGPVGIAREALLHNWGAVLLRHSISGQPPGEAEGGGDDGDELELT